MFAYYYKCYISIELTFLKELMLIKQVHQKSVVFVTILVFLDKGFKFEPSVCNRCHDLLMSMNLSDIKSADYCYIISGISKNEAINSMQNADLTEKKVKNLLSCIKMGTEILTFWGY